MDSAADFLCEWFGISCETKILQDNLNVDQEIFDMTEPFMDPFVMALTTNGAALAQVNQLESINLLIDSVALDRLSISVLDSVPGADLLPPGIDHASELGIAYFEVWRNNNNSQIGSLLGQTAPQH